MRLVALESPYAGNMIQRWLNVRYARRCVRDCLSRNESPVASHLLFTQRGILRDGVPEERRLGINAGLAWSAKAEAMVIYVDRGVSGGMKAAVVWATKRKLPIEYRRLSKKTERRLDE